MTSVSQRSPRGMSAQLTGSERPDCWVTVIRKFSVPFLFGVSATVENGATATVENEAT